VSHRAPRSYANQIRPFLDHLDIVVSSLERSLPFYRGLLEPLGVEYDHHVRGERGETIHYLGGKGLPGALGLREAQAEGHFDRYRVGLHHICFSAGSRDQVDDRGAWLREQGAEIESGPQDYDYRDGYYAVFFYDPDGLKLEIAYIPD
jgi:catechol 2,3-dioxygenase-like lactoylglutathione lyase family enzyme